MPISEFLESYGIVSIVVAVLLFLELLLVCIVASKNDFGKYLFLYLPVSLFGAFFSVVAITVAKNEIVSIVYFVTETVFSLFSILLFPTEFRQIFAKKAKKTVDAKRGEKKPEAEVCIASIIKALQNMSKNDIGALVVLSGGNLPKQVLDSGTKINADISSQLLEALFFPKAPLHDGAVVLEGHKITAAGCFLPLTTNLNYPKELGTRHRAAIGITEVANVTALVVSEETGIISYVRQGKVTRYADYDMLRHVLEEYYWKDLSVEKK